MGIARITSNPNTKTKINAYLNHDIHRKNKKHKLYLKVLCLLLVLSVVCNIILLTR